MALDLLTFLRRFQQSTPKLELCDLKYSHFGYLKPSLNSSQQQVLVLLDSDMIYPQSTVKQSISSVESCNSHEDCHFVDCQGECQSSSGSCHLSRSDTDLKRLCRNILFMGHLYSQLPLEFGLLAGLAASGEFEHEIAKLREHCFDPENSQASRLDSLHLSAMEAILERMLARL